MDRCRHKSPGSDIVYANNYIFISVIMIGNIIIGYINGVGFVWLTFRCCRNKIAAVLYYFPPMMLTKSLGLDHQDVVVVLNINVVVVVLFTCFCT